MTIRAWAFCGGAAFLFSACAGSNSGSSSGNGGTTGQATTGQGTTGHHTTSGFVPSTGGEGTTGEAPTSGGSTTSGAAGGSGSGTTTGGSTGAGVGTTTGGSPTGTGGSSTGYPMYPPYQGYDSGMPPEPNVDPGCTPAAPFTGGYYCVGCRTSADCATGLVCDSTQQCVACRDASDCPAGQVCSSSCHRIEVEPYYVCDVSCQIDCRSPDAGPDFCKPGACDGDAGGCLSGQCYENSDCVVNGLGACDFNNKQYYGYGNCAACTKDAGGCGADAFCVYDQNTGYNVCQLNCLIDAGVCGNGSYCSDAGTCAPGCQNSNDCIGSSGGSICHQGQCIGCLTGATCPDYNSGCNPQYSSGSPTCGYCTSDDDCLGGGGSQHCETNKGSSYYTNQCGCHADSECPTDAPVCVGVDPSQGFPAGSGRCACTDSSQCPSQQGVQFVCESRYPYTVYNGSYGPAVGGACIAPCNVDLTGTDLVGTDCASAGIGAPNPNTYYPNGAPPTASVCNAATGYCVPCAQPTDCYIPPVGPATAPSCVAFDNGLDPSSGEPTGGGQCACNDTSQCTDGWACWNPGINGSCQPPCSIIDGVDSCNPYRQYYYYQPPTNPFCNTWTGACVECLDNWGCTNVTVNYIDGLYAYPGFAAPNCSPTGQCVGCSSDADCPTSAPNCTQGFCGLCTGPGQCYSDAGFTCEQFNGTGSAGRCTVTGCVGDSNEYATDGGAICPSGLPYCPQTEICSNTCSFPTICAECRPDYYPPYDKYWGDCPNGYCENSGTCYNYY